MTLEEELIAAETRRFEATVRADPAALRECLSEKLLYVHSNGATEGRDAFIDKLQSGERKYFGFTPGKRIVRALGGPESAASVAACVGELEVQGQSEKGKVVVHLAYTAVYEKAPHWKMVLWHACSLTRASA